MNNKFRKDISIEDMKTKFPLVAKNTYYKTKFKIRDAEFGGKEIPIFAGPNMVENKEMIFKIAKNVKKNGKILRGGAFKPLSFFLIEVPNILKRERRN